MRFTQMLRGSASLAVLTTVVAGAGAAFAAAPPADTEVTSVKEIVVTAQKREQNLQDVPVVVTSLPGKLLQDAGVKDIKDLTVLTPGLTVTSTSNETITTARIRGVGTVGDNPGLESSVGVVIDGVYRPRNGVSFGDLGETDRIEVLKGPQGTLFGKNTSAGVINIVTKAPAFNFDAQGELTAGDHGAVGGSASVTGPITDQVAARLYFADRKRDGFYNVITAGGPRTTTDDQDQNFWTLRGQLLFQPSDKASIRIIGDYTERNEHCCVAVQTRTGPTGAIVNGLAVGGQGVQPAAPGFATLPYSRTAYANRDTGQDIKDKGISAEGNVDLDWANFTSISSFREWSTMNGQDIDYSGADILYRNKDDNNSNKFDTFSQEFRLAGKTSFMDWLVGAFYADEELTSKVSYLYGTAYTPYLSLIATSGASATLIPCLTGTFTPGPNCNGPTFTPGLAVADHYAQNDHSLAFFTNETFHVTDKFDITAGLRWTEDDKTLNSFYQNVGSNGAACGAGLGNFAGGKWTLLGIPAASQPTLAGLLCLPWANPQFANRNTHQKSHAADTSGTVKGSYHFTSDIMGYISYSKGSKAGGFNLDRIQSSNGLPSGGTGFTPVTDTSFPAEVAHSFEVGAKTTWLDGKLLLNATYFDQTFNHFQLNTFLGTSFVVESIPEVSSRGVDADFLYFTPIKGLTLQGGVTYADTKYGNFTASDLISSSHFAQLSLLPGHHVSFAPLVSASGAISYDHKIADSLRFMFNLDAKYTSSYNTGSDLLPAKQQSAMTLLNGRVGFGAADHRWTVELWGQNLTDVKYKQVVFNGPLQGSAFQSTPTASGPYAGTFYNPALDSQTYDAFLGTPRTVGVTLRVRY
jgi:outer membrane receptor protein involved in Fe transport